MNFLDLINWLGPTLLLVMLISATRHDAGFNLAKPVVTAFAALVADLGFTLLTLFVLRQPLGPMGATWFYMLSVATAVALLIRFITRISWKASAIMGAFYMVATVGVKIILSNI